MFMLKLGLLANRSLEKLNLTYELLTSIRLFCIFCTGIAIGEMLYMLM